MLQASKNDCFLFKGNGSFFLFLRIQTTLAHLFESDLAVTKQYILCPVHCSEAALADRRNDTIALLQQNIRQQLPGCGIVNSRFDCLQRTTAGATEACL